MVRFPNWVRSCVLCQRYRDGECIPASAMWGDKTRLDIIVLQLAYKRRLAEIFRQFRKDFLEVERGREAHENLENRRQVVRSLPELLKRLQSGVVNVPFTARGCSRYYGQRCLPDVVYFTLRRDRPVPVLDVVIVEDKKEFRPTYLLQLYSMGVIFTDFHVMAQAAPVGEPRADLEREFMESGVFLYEFLKEQLGLAELRVDVYVSLNVYEDAKTPTDKPVFRTLFSRDFKIVSEMERQFLSARRRRNDIIRAIAGKRPYVVPLEQTHFTTRPRRRARVVSRLDERYTLYVPKA